MKESNKKDERGKRESKHKDKQSIKDRESGKGRDSKIIEERAKAGTKNIRKGFWERERERE